jgi:hypothetical protein
MVAPIFDITLAVSYPIPEFAPTQKEKRNFNVF